MSTSATNALAFDANSLNDLKRLSRDNSPAALKAAAQQFEAVLMQMVLKSMREATPQDGMFDSDQTKAYQQLLDQQLGQTLTAQSSTGLAAVIEKQLGRQFAPVTVPEESRGLPLNPTENGLPITDKLPLKNSAMQAIERYAAAAAAGQVPARSSAANPAAAIGALPERIADLPPGADEFVQRVWPHALEASRETGIPAHFMVAQAALETGWGKSEVRRSDGSTSHNLFNIKATRSWEGATADATTTEYANGAATRQIERFRAYGSYAEAFKDYARLISNSPRYAGVVGQNDPVAFARGLQQAGYATDPQYANKLERIINGGALRTALAGGV